MKAVIPAAGLGTRFLPATKAQPKEMLPVLDKPAIQYVVEESARGGISDILIVTGRGKRAVEDHFDRSYELEGLLKSKGDHETIELLHYIEDLAEIHYVRQKESLGLGHAVLKAKHHVGDEYFACLLGDTITVGKDSVIGKMAEISRTRGCSVIGVERVPRAKVESYGIIAGDPIGDGMWRMTDMVEKPSVDEAPSDLAAFGRYILSPRIFEILENTPPGRNNEIQLTDALRTLLKEEEMIAVEITDPHFDIGSVADWLLAMNELAMSDPGLRPVLEDRLRELLK